MHELDQNQFLVSEFEQGRAPGDFHHADHVRVAFAYVSQFPVLEAIAKFSAALRRFALAKGKPHLYHETITWAYMLLIHESIACGASLRQSSVSQSVVGQRRSRPTWQEFSDSNPGLLVWKGGVLERYYSQGVLNSSVARQVFVFPDRGL